MPLPTRLIGQGAIQEVFPDAGRATDHDVLMRTYPAAGHQEGEQRPVEAARMPVIHIFRVGGLFQLGAFQERHVLAQFALYSLAVDEVPNPRLTCLKSSGNKTATYDASWVRQALQPRHPGR